MARRITCAESGDPATIDGKAEIDHKNNWLELAATTEGSEVFARMMRRPFSSGWRMALVGALPAGIEQRLLAQMRGGSTDGDRLGSENNNNNVAKMVSSGNFDRLKSLLEADANPDATGEDGKTALHYSAMFDNVEGLSALLTAKASIEMEDEEGTTALGESALIVATRMEAAGCVKELLENKADPNLKSSRADVDSPLFLSILHNNSRCFDLLVKMKANLNAQDKKGDTPLGIACMSNHDIAKKLIAVKADLDKSNLRGDTPLMLCGMYSAPAVAKLLVEAKCDVNLKNKDGQTAGELASQASFTETDKEDLLIKVRKAQARGDHEEAREFLQAWKESRGVFSS
eukprot:jgi/Bigna1/87226/estExt_fgenesh1_pg.C_180020